MSSRIIIRSLVYVLPSFLHLVVLRPGFEIDFIEIFFLPFDSNIVCLNVLKYFFLVMQRLIKQKQTKISKRDLLIYQKFRQKLSRTSTNWTESYWIESYQCWTESYWITSESNRYLFNYIVFYCIKLSERGRFQPLHQGYVSISFVFKALFLAKAVGLILLGTCVIILNSNDIWIAHRLTPLN